MEYHVIPSKDPVSIRTKAVAKEFNAMLMDKGNGWLFHPAIFGPASVSSRPRASRMLRRTRIILEAVKLGLHVPQSMPDEVKPPVEPNPRVPPCDPNEEPF